MEVNKVNKVNEVSEMKEVKENILYQWKGGRSREEIKLPLDLHYNAGKSEYFFSSLWLFLALSIIYFINLYSEDFTIEKIIFYSASFICFVYAFLSIIRNGSIYVTLLEKEIIVYPYPFQKRIIPYDRILRISYHHEEADILIKGRKEKITVILRNLAFENQDIFMDVLASKTH